MSTKRKNPRARKNDLPWQQTMCMLCGTNCGVEVQIEGRHIKRVRGDKAHPVSQGYLCNKAAKLDLYQNHLRRVKQPLKRNASGEFEPIESAPEPYDELLNHHKHMTVTVESHYGENVDVHVHRCQQQENWYAREITLATTESRRIVQYGIVRLDTTALDEPVWRRIESQQVPLGRVLIEHNVLREVQLCGLWRIQAGPSLAALLRVTIGSILWGRTALIYCDGEPAIQLLEILTPTTTSPDRPPVTLD